MPLLSTNTRTVLLLSPAALVPLKLSVPALVMLSLCETPVSTAALPERSGAPGVEGATLTVMVRVAVAAPSLTWMVKVSLPAKPAFGW